MKTENNSVEEFVPQESFSEKQIGNLKSFFSKNKAKEVSLDAFLYGALEEEQWFKSLDPKHQRLWPLLVLDQFPEIKEVEALQRFFTWFLEAYPEFVFQKGEVLTYERHEQFSSVLGALFFQINLVLHKAYRSRLPAREATAASEAFWSPIDAVIVEFFPNMAQFVLSYLNWVYQKSKQSEHDLASMQPVGRFIGILKRESTTTSSASSHNAPASDSVDHHTIHAPRAPTKSSGENISDEGLDPAQLAEQNEALMDLDQALKAVLEDAALSHMDLKPQNSYLRRVQHQRISELGFVSESIGEGVDRAIRISRPPAN